MTTNKFGRYEINSELGRGGMATVFHASDPNFERDVAIKVLPHEFLHDSQFRTRFEREAKMIALLEHPAIVPVYDFGEEDGQPYIVMRYMSGGSLADRLSQGPIPLDEAVQIVTRLSPALDAAHSKGIIHRDLKPGNILFDQYGNAFLSDFGIARLAQGSGSTLTGTTILGTPAYMSPEQVQGDKELDGRSDLYALGVIFYQMLTGSVPYQSDTPAKTMMMHLLEPVPHAHRVRQDISPAYDAVIEHAMAKEPNQRFSTAGEMAAAINTIASAIASGKEAPHLPFMEETVVAPSKSGRGPAQRTAPRTALAGRTTAATPGAAALPRRSFPLWGGIAIGGVVVGFVVIAAVIGVFLIAKGSSHKATATSEIVAQNPSPTPEPTQILTPTQLPVSTPTIPPTATLAPTNTPAPNDTPPPTETTVPLVMPTDTPVPTNTDTATPIPTDTPTSTPSILVVGGADKIAFVNANDIYIANIDGSELKQLTTDHAKKSQLEWLSDGQAILYISGTRIQTVDLEGKVEVVVSFDYAEYLDAFEVSPDGKKVAISLNHELFIIPLDWERLAQARSKSALMAMADCADHAPVVNSIKVPIIVKSVRWSNDSQKMAVIIVGAEGGVRQDLIDLWDVSYCGLPNRLDEFPATRFTISGYNTNPTIQNFGWDGGALFALTGIKRNDGFGDLYVYNAERHQPRTTLPNVNYINPINGTCCYRDPRWSPDGSYLLFAFQDIGLGQNSPTQLYYIPYGTIGTGMAYTPLPLPPEMLTNPREKPQAALRPAK